MNVALEEWLGVEAQVEPSAMPAGRRGSLGVTLRIPRGGHVETNEPEEPFLIPTEVRVEEGEDLVFGPPAYPPGEVKAFPWSPVVLRVFRGDVLVAVPFVVLADARPGGRWIRGRVRYQGCTEALCLPPAERAFETTVTVTTAEEG